MAALLEAVEEQYVERKDAIAAREDSAIVLGTAPAMQGENSSSSYSAPTDDRPSSSDEDSRSSSVIDEDVEMVLDVESYGSKFSWESDEYAPLELNHEALKHIGTYYLPGNHGRCADIKTLERGSYHEIRVLQFEDGWECIGRFTRNLNEPLSVTESEFATVKYVRKHTNLPVPETYLVNFDPTNAVGAAFVIMEKMPGIHLYEIMDKLTTQQKLDVIDQIADILVQLSGLKFDKIGSINIHGEVGVLQSKAVPPDEPDRGPFDTVKDYMSSFISQNVHTTAEVRSFYPDIQRHLHKLLDDQTDDPLYNPPFRLIHGDFDAQNLLFTWASRAESPKLSGIIDWDYSYTGPLYYLYEYPIFIQDNSTFEEARARYPENKILRKDFVRKLAQKFPKGSVEREDVKESFRQKTFLMNTFRNEFMTYRHQDPELELRTARGFARMLNGDSKEPLHAYNGRPDYESDSELESDDEAE